MQKYRIKIASALNDFRQEINRLEKYDNENQKRFITNPPTLTNHQMHLLTEAIFFRAFRAYESFIREIFLLYCNEKQPNKRKKVRSFINAKNFSHTEDLIRSSMRYLDWNNPEEIIKRAELYLKDGYPIKLPYSSNRTALHNYRRIRNHIAHNTKESQDKYNIVLREHFGVIPITIPSPGEYLLLSNRNNPSKYNLQCFFEFMNNIANELT